MTKKIISLPNPAGSYQVGRTHLNFIDENRTDPSSQADGKKRDIPILIWYPIDDPGDNPPLKLLKQRDLVNLKQIFYYKFIPKKTCDILTNCYEDAPISNKSSNFPLLIFNHGFTSFMEQSTLLMEHLTSFGYIVASVGHPDDGVASYPDGRSVPMDVNFYKEHVNNMKKERKTLKALIKEIQREDLTIEDMKMYTQKFLLLSGAMNDRVEVWVDDVLFIMNTLEKMNNGVIKSQFERKMALEKGVGLFGHSYGGVTSILSCCLDERFKCGINMDGGMFGGMKKKYKYKQPSMYMLSDSYPIMNKYFYNINDDDSYYVIVKNSKHLDYSDYTYIMKSWFSKLIGVFGKIDGRQMIKITNDYVLSFFDKYIRGIDSPLLENNPYSEVAFEKRLKE